MKANGLIERAIANDFDGFIEGMSQRIETKKKIFERFRELGIEPSEAALRGDDRKKVLEFAESLTHEERVIACDKFVFSAARTEREKVKARDFVYFFGYPDFEKEEAYFEKSKGIETMRADYRDFLETTISENEKGTIIIVDPPYLNSTQKSYKNEIFFGLAETIDLLKWLQEKKVDFIFFNQIEKDTKKLLELFDFEYEVKTKTARMGSVMRREDVLVYVKQ